MNELEELISPTLNVDQRRLDAEWAGTQTKTGSIPDKRWTPLVLSTAVIPTML